MGSSPGLPLWGAWSSFVLKGLKPGPVASWGLMGGQVSPGPSLPLTKSPPGGLTVQVEKPRLSVGASGAGGGHMGSGLHLSGSWAGVGAGRLTAPGPWQKSL